ncbi:MAG: prolipoprotein diacylglyceryl transferase [Dehalococcoidia bacterium]
MFDISMQSVTIGPLEIRFYSIMILSGLLAGVLLAQREAKRLGENPEHVVNIAVLGAVFGIIGARLYHVVDANYWPYYRDNPGQIIAIWNGGIGIFGAIAGAALALVVYVWWVNRNAAQQGRRGAGKRMDPLRWFDIGAPAFLLGQAIGRWGNFFNQELFGPPTDLPWGIPIPMQNRPEGYEGFTHFHPLFLYESLLSLLGVVVLLFVARRYAHWVRPGDILLMYLIWYPATRFLLEFMRIGNWQFGDIPMAQIVSALFILAAAGLLVWRHRHAPPPPASDADGEQQSARSRAAARRQRRRSAETGSDG